MATATKRWSLGLWAIATLGLTPAAWPSPAQASPPLLAQAAPVEVEGLLTELQLAASDRDLDAVMAFYSESFASDTGFDYAQLRQTLEALWQQYPDITYDIELLSWQADGPGNYTLETRTTVTGKQVQADRVLTLNADVTSRQRLENGQIAYQETLAETSRLVSGENPPTLQVQLPETLSPGQTYSFDTIVLEPLGENTLMGAAVEEGVTATDFFEPRPVVFDILSSGGLYKVGTAPAEPDSRWVSTVVIREDGLVVETRRVQVE
ncbi:nuclear transport factor 2 family protein [Nodosilinea sp. LEGE 07088]|uniref:nuclear transport factor 2 family protein n=1 Tax=Nodosilinea sp. LEGE 07088 TaxID=2777968 RepID=UPI001882F372|nr:nuclear transport factor 2 family protein [Nodosilinea sp. LEGE 07088]MBE9139324.1 nuclear transport factor 2 family protein [Nodosilinea sp. LEGE 07088]